MISIIVTSNDSRRRNDILDLLKSIKRQTDPSFELVYVIEGDQRLQEIIHEGLSRLGLSALIIKNNGSRGLSEARNIGAKASEGDILAFVDDDVELDSEWVSSIHRAFRNIPDIVGVSGPASPLWVNFEPK